MLRFNTAGDTLAVYGGNHEFLSVVDVETSERSRLSRCRINTVTSASWNPTQPALCSVGLRNSEIRTYDSRAQAKLVGIHQAHTQGICGIQWSPDGRHLASGGNENAVHVWDARKWSRPIISITDGHRAAVRAIAWSPWKSTALATGGGTEDQTIRIWDLSSSRAEGVCRREVGDQVCALVWSTLTRDLVSSQRHGDVKISVWVHSGDELLLRDALIGHSGRPLHLALSPDGTMLASAAGDETMRFWDVFEDEEPSVRSRSSEGNTGRIKHFLIR